MISADTMGRVHAVVDVGQLRDGLHQIYSRLKRNTALPLNLGLDVAVLDGHEQHASYLRHCAGCLERTVKTRTGRAHSVLPPASHTHAFARAWRWTQAPAPFVGLRADASR